LEFIDKTDHNSENGNIQTNDGESLPKDPNIETAISQDSSKPAFSSYAKKSEQGLFPIRKIFITVDGNTPENEDFVRSHMKLSENDPFNPHLADEAIHSLFATNFFEDIHFSADQNEDGTLDLSFSLTMRPKIAAIEYPHEKVNNKKLKKD
jgi:outer membrane protein assembly factor BamA